MFKFILTGLENSFISKNALSYRSCLGLDYFDYNFKVAQATTTRTKTWASGDVLTAADLNAEFNGLLGALALVNADIGSGANITASKLDSTVVETDTTQTITGVKTFTGTPKMDAIDAATTTHITITPGTSKFVKIAVLRQDDTTNAYKNNTVILMGWGYFQGNSTKFQAKTVTFNSIFSDNPIVLISSCGIINSVPTGIESFTDGSSDATNYTIFSTRSITTTVFASLFHNSGAISSTSYLGFSWIAIGQLN